ncbi:hypothetical protein ACKKBF_B35920 [Auxenochlorella protothecoides x Auxenochlorella symbiontica]|uniref:Uncharacterized protein n=2 Tax=Auxenochlorella protothecoides TaxID=3075 RepID=A0A1D2AG83_AUXPR
MPSGTLAGRSQDLPTLGPLCDHAEPTVLKDLNSAKVYVCPRYPHHHCNRWCLAEVAILRAESSLPAPGPIKAHESDMTKTRDLLSEEEVTTPHQAPLSPRQPDAPCKSTSSKSMVDRMFPSPAVRCLGPSFNLPLVSRASQMGGRYVSLRKEARAMAEMQSELEGSTSSGPDSPATLLVEGGGRKRPRPGETPEALRDTAQTPTPGPPPATWLQPVALSRTAQAAGSRPRLPGSGQGPRSAADASKARQLRFSLR